jgi:AraC-like DNA-binding protein
VSLSGPWILCHRGQEAVLQAGQGMLVTAGEPFGAKRPVEGQMLGICLSRGALAPLVRDLDDAAGRFLPEDNPALRLLIGYARMLNADPLVETSGVGHLVCDHFCDLLATALGATRDASVAAQSRGIRAAQFAMLRQDIVRNAGHRNLSVETLASRHRVTTRGVQRLFEAEGTTFSQVLLEARLERAYCALTDVSAARRSIGEIAYDCGFGDISYFNRSFRRAFGITPSDLRGVD